MVVNGEEMGKRIHLSLESGTRKIRLLLLECPEHQGYTFLVYPKGDKRQCVHAGGAKLSHNPFTTIALDFYKNVKILIEEIYTKSSMILWEHCYED
ncbi:hypothetical protein V6N13_046229 [Hibiscus sabdariffa]